MSKTTKQFLKAKGWPEPALEEMDHLTELVRQKAENYLKTIRDGKVQVVAVTGQNNFYKDAIVGVVLLGSPGFHYVHSPTLDILPENGNCYYFARFDSPMDFKQAYHIRNQVFKVVSRGGMAFLGVNSIDSMANIHTDGFQREYNSVMDVLNVASVHKTLSGSNI